MRHWSHAVGSRLAAGFCVLTSVVAVTGEAAAQPSDSHQPPLIVRSYAREAGDDRRAAQALATAILHRTKIDVQWLDCAISESPDTRRLCNRPPGANEVLLRFASGGLVELQRVETLGFALVDVGEGDGRLATVYADRVRAMARRVGISPVRLLGRAIAHEIGHLLLGTNQHASSGLMRAVWSGADLRRNVATDWRFLESEAAAMRAGLAPRIAEQPREGIGNREPGFRAGPG